MADQPPPERSEPPPLQAAPAAESRPRHRALVSLILALAPVLLVLSITANWVQADALDTQWVTDASKEIIAEPSVEEALAVYGVDQLFATVDARGEISGRTR